MNIHSVSVSLLFKGGRRGLKERILVASRGLEMLLCMEDAVDETNRLKKNSAAKRKNIETVAFLPEIYFIYSFKRNV